MRVVIFLMICVFTYCVNAQNTPSLATLTVELESNQRLPLPLGNKISLELITSKPLAIAESLQHWDGISVISIATDNLLIEMDLRPLFTGKVEKEYLFDSFVIDISEKSTAEFTSGFINNTNQPIQLSQLEAYVGGYIDTTTYVNGFNIASVVASQRSGDCTEYAVLLAALARSIELPARVIIGTVIIEEKEKVSAFGHAWVEVWHNEHWNILDAALYQSQAIQHFYLPAAALENEGPGFNMSLAKASALLPNKLKALQSVK